MRLSDLPILNPATADLPKYRQIAAVLEEYLQRANLPEGERFFSDRALAKRFSTTSVTISHSLNYLVNKGLLCRLCSPCRPVLFCLPAVFPIFFRWILPVFFEYSGKVKLIFKTALVGDLAYLQITAA